MTVNGVNILLDGDMIDRPSIHPLLSYSNYQIASEINEELDIYKVPHHGTPYCNEEKTLDIYKPKIAVITNGEEYVKNSSTIYNDLKRVNEDVKILFTEKQNVIITITNDGKIICE